MGRTPGHGNWPEENEIQFLQILCERIRKDPDNSSLRNSDWEEVDNELVATVGVRYGIERLKGKYTRLSYKFRYFIELLETAGVSWNPDTNTVHASDETWQALIKQNKEFRKFRKKGCKHYGLLRHIFPNITAGHSHPFSLQLSGNSNVRHQIEGGNINQRNVAGEHQPKKKSKAGRFDEALHAWASTVDSSNMGRTPGNGNWSEENEIQFLRILCEKMRKDPDKTSLRNSDWEEIDNELVAAVGVRYGIEKLKGKYTRMSYMFRYFLELVQKTGVTWNANTNTVHASDETWQTLIKQNKEFRKFRKKGCKHYDLLRQIFPNIAAAHSHHFSLQLSGNSNVRHQIEGGNIIQRNVAGEHEPKKKLKSERFDQALHAWVTALDARTMDRVYNGRGESQASKDIADASEPLSVQGAMEILGSMSGVPTAVYMKAVDKFKHPDWRNIFIRMSPAKRREWLKSLE